MPEPTQADPTLSEVNAAELDFMAGHLAFIAANAVPLDDADAIAAFYEALLRSWSSVPEADRPDPNDLINVIGTALGEHIVRGSALAWKVATDAQSTELVVHDEQRSILVYPSNVVAKRWSAGESGDFIPGLSADVIARSARDS